MTHSRLLSIFCALLATSACNGGKQSDESGSSTDATGDSDGTMGTTTTPEPLQCGYGNEILDEGDEVESVDGCVTYMCTSGALVVSDDRRATVAGDLELATQEAVDEQSCLGVVEGNLVISGTAADLTPLASLYRVGAELQITASAAVTLTGLEGVGEVGGNITIADNASLTTLAFQPFMTALGDITIQNNDALASLTGAEFIGQCGACIVAGAPGDLVDDANGVAGGSAGGTTGADSGGEDSGAGAPGGDGFDEPSGGTFYGTILIADNDVLADVYAISNLYFAWSDVRFRNNAVLGSLVGLQLVEVRGDLEISDHPTMSTLDAESFAAGISVLGTTTICGNADGVACQ